MTAPTLSEQIAAVEDQAAGIRQMIERSEDMSVTPSWGRRLAMLEAAAATLKAMECFAMTDTSTKPENPDTSPERVNEAAKSVQKGKAALAKIAAYESGHGALSFDKLYSVALDIAAYVSDLEAQIERMQERAGADIAAAMASGSFLGTPDPVLEDLEERLARSEARLAALSEPSDKTMIDGIVALLKFMLLHEGQSEEEAEIAVADIQQEDDFAEKAVLVMRAALAAMHGEGK